jgi:hypothetical protein
MSSVALISFAIALAVHDCRGATSQMLRREVNPGKIERTAKWARIIKEHSQKKQRLSGETHKLEEAKRKSSHKSLGIVMYASENYIDELTVQVMHNASSKGPDGLLPILLFTAPGQKDMTSSRLAKFNAELSQLNITVREAETAVHGTRDISAFEMSSKNLDAIPWEKFWLIQEDNTICMGPSTPALTEFLNVDYIGAPWSGQVGQTSSGQVGNGGNSLRTTSVMKKIAKAYNTGEASDVFISTHVVDSGGVLAPVALAKRFSVEQVFYDNPLAAHPCAGPRGTANPFSFGQWKVTVDQVKSLFYHCPNFGSCYRYRPKSKALLPPRVLPEAFADSSAGSEFSFIEQSATLQTMRHSTSLLMKRYQSLSPGVDFSNYNIVNLHLAAETYSKKHYRKMYLAGRNLAYAWQRVEREFYESLDDGRPLLVYLLQA